MFWLTGICCLGQKQRSIAPGGSVGRRSTISYDAKAAASTPPVMDPARYIFNYDNI